MLGQRHLSIMVTGWEGIMKALLLLALVVLSGGLCAAQTQSSETAAPGVRVVESGWRRRLIRNPALEIDPLASLEAQDRQERYRDWVIQQNAIRASHGKDQAPLPSRNATGPLPPRRSAYPFIYIYKVKITNTGAKKISGFVWEYLLLDSSGSEVGRHRFVSNVSVSAGKSKTLYGHSTLPPASTVDANSAGEVPEGQHSEHVVIKTIIYDDKSVWQRAVE